jgi:hypothetical protein
MKNLQTFIFLLLSPGLLQAQTLKTTVFSSGGGASQTASYSSFGTFGQPLSTCVVGTNYQSKEGFIFAQQNLLTVTIAADQTICNNTAADTLTSEISGSEGAVTCQWQKLDGVVWVDLTNATSTTYDPGFLTESTEYRLLVDDRSGVGQVTSNSVIVTVRDMFTTGAIATAGEAICYNANPAEISSTTAASGGDNAISYQWQCSTTSGSTGFADIGSATGTTYDPPTGLTTTTWYRRMAKDGTCNTTFATSAGVWQVIVHDNFTPGAINTAGETICYNGDPDEIGSATGASGGDNSISYQWQKSTTDGSSNFAEITGATVAAYDPPAGLAQITWYRRLAKDGTCNTTFEASTGVWQVTVHALFTAGAITTTGETICYNGDPVEISSATAASGGDNSISYQWQKSTIDGSSNFTDITGATITSYDPPTGLTQTTWYRRLAKDGTCNTTFEASTGVWQVTVHALFTAGAIATTGETICYNGNPSEISSAITASGGDNSISYQWQKSTIDGSSNFADITGATVAAYDPPTGMTQTTWYRRLAKDGTCNTTFEASTGVWQVTVHALFTAGAITTTGETICYNGNPAEISNSTAASGGDNSIIYQWQKSTTDGSSNFADITGATIASYDPPTGLTQTTWYRRLAKDGTCKANFEASTGTWTVTVYENFVVGSVSAGQDICENSAPALLNSVGPTGGNTPYTYQWQSSTTLGTDGSGSGFTDITGASASTYQPGALTTTTYYRMQQVSASGCGSFFTNIITVTVEPTPVSGTVTKDQNVTNICEGTDVSATIAAGSGGNGTDVQEYRTKSGGNWSSWSDYTSGTAISTTGKTDIEITAYRTATYCSNSTPNTVAWIIDPTTAGGTVTGGTQVCFGTNSTEITLSDYTGTIQKWQYSTNSGVAWTDITGATNETYMVENITVATWYRAVVQSGVCTNVYSTHTAFTINADFHISGYAKYENNPKTPLDGLKITLKKDNVVQTSMLTNSLGYYEFGGLVNGNYSLEISSAHPSGLWQTWGGVNNTDALIVLNHINNVTPLVINPPVVRVTASVKAPHPAIASNDYTAIRQAAKFPGTGYTYFDISKWVFSGATTTTGLTDITIGCANVTRDIRGLCASDVNGTYVPVSGYKTAEPGLALVNRGTLPLTDEIVFPVRVDRETPIGAITLFLNYDPALISITGVEMPENKGVEPSFETRDGVLYIGWVSMESIRVEHDGTLLLIHARLTEEFRISHFTIGDSHLDSDDLNEKREMRNVKCKINFTLNENPLSELADSEGNVIAGLTLSIPNASLSSEMEKWRIDEILVYPNPAKAVLNIEFESVSPETETLTMELVNVQGVSVIKYQTEAMLPGWQKHQVDLGGLAPGVYFLRANIGGEVLMNKVVISR